MWHEARKQERKIRGLLVDYRKRAERRQNFYEKIASSIKFIHELARLITKIYFLTFQKADPTQFLQIHGRKCKIHIDLNIAMAAENPKIMQVIL
jgi:splicing factor, arginine/serine-rich 16